MQVQFSKNLNAAFYEREKTNNRKGYHIENESTKIDIQQDEHRDRSVGKYMHDNQKHTT